MTPTECVDVVEFLAARCPAMRMHEQTPDAWYVDLANHTRDDAIEAVRRRSRTQTFVSLAELLDELDSIVRTRTGRARLTQLEQQIVDENPPGELRDAAVGALKAGDDIPRIDLRTEVMRVADGRRRATKDDVRARSDHAARVALARRELEQLRAAQAASETATASRSTGPAS